MGLFRLENNSGHWDWGVWSEVTEGRGLCGEGDTVEFTVPFLGFSIAGFNTVLLTQRPP